MLNYRSIAQGEYFITNDSNTVLITEGMTECIAMAFVDKANSNLRLLAHLDGFLLADRQTASLNLNILINAFTLAGSTNFEIYALGGKEGVRNHKILKS